MCYGRLPGGPPHPFGGRLHGPAAGDAQDRAGQHVGGVVDVQIQPGKRDQHRGGQRRQPQAASAEVQRRNCGKAGRRVPGREGEIPGGAISSWTPGSRARGAGGRQAVSAAGCSRQSPAPAPQQHPAGAARLGPQKQDGRQGQPQGGAAAQRSDGRHNGINMPQRRLSWIHCKIARSIEGSFLHGRFERQGKLPGAVRALAGLVRPFASAYTPNVNFS